MTMAPELPSRPKPDPDDEQTIIDPQERVKSAHDKPDPRFEAARQKAEREAKVYAERADRVTEDDPVSDDPEEDLEGADPSDSTGTFSFNMTTGDGEEDE